VTAPVFEVSNPPPGPPHLTSSAITTPVARDYQCSLGREVVFVFIASILTQQMNSASFYVGRW
jgi:hypothetical protein